MSSELSRCWLIGSYRHPGPSAVNLWKAGEKREVAALAAPQPASIGWRSRPRKFHPEVVAVFEAAPFPAAEPAGYGPAVSPAWRVCVLPPGRGADLTLNPVVGMVGLQPTLAAPCRRGRPCPAQQRD